MVRYDCGDVVEWSEVEAHFEMVRSLVVCDHVKSLGTRFLFAPLIRPIARNNNFFRISGLSVISLLTARNRYVILLNIPLIPS